jgi:hypothetical protein
MPEDHLGVAGTHVHGDRLDAWFTTAETDD